MRAAADPQASFRAEKSAISTHTLRRAAGFDGQPFPIRGQDSSTHKDPSDHSSGAELPLPDYLKRVIQKTPNDLTSGIERYESLGMELITLLKPVADDLIAPTDGNACIEIDINMTAESEEQQQGDSADPATLISQYCGAMNALLNQRDVGSNGNTNKEALREREANPHSELSPSFPTNIPDDAQEGIHGDTGDNGSRQLLRAPEEQRRSQLLQLDDRIQLPPTARLADLDPPSLRLLGAMRSPLALIQLSEIAQQSSLAIAESGSMGEDVEMELGHLIGICKKIQLVERDSALAGLKLRYYDIQLFLELEKRRGARVRSNPVDVQDIINRCGWKHKQFWYHYAMGKKAHLICGGHIGLSVFIPFNSPNLFDIAPSKTLHLMTDTQAAALGRIMKDEWASNMCIVGKEVMLAAISNNIGGLRRSTKRLLDRNNEYKTISLADLNRLVHCVISDHRNNNLSTNNVSARCGCES